jgi:hypothetical protein
MYDKVDLPKKVTQNWLDQAFAPLRHYLNKHRPHEVERIASYLMFMGNEDGKFYYKNSITRDSITFDQNGELLVCGSSALDYEFEWPPVGREKPIEDDNKFYHPNVDRWIDQNLNAGLRRRYGEEVRLMLQELWGPCVNFDFDDLKAGCPLKRARSPYCLYLYPSEFQSFVAFQFVGDEIVEKRCTYEQYRDYERLDREMTLQGWRVITLIREYLESELPLLRASLAKQIEFAELRNPSELS